MIFLLIAIPVILLCSTAVGSFVLHLFRATDVSGDPVDQIAIAFWLGLCVFGSFLEFLGLFHVASVWVTVPVCLSLVAFSSRFAFRAYPVSRSLRVSSALLLIFVASHCASLKIDAYDTGLYHASAVGFLAKYGLVRGISWFNFRLGFTSSWFSFGALFNHGFLKGRAGPIVSGALLFLTGAHWLSKVEKLGMASLDSYDWFLLVAYPGIFAGAWLWHLELSLSPDPPGWIISILVAWTMLLYNAHRNAHCSWIPFLLASFGSAIKLSSLPLALVALAFAGAFAPWRRKLLSQLVCLAACSAPALIAFSANLETSGCPIFPSAFGCLSTDWTVKRAFVDNVAAQISAYARTSNVGSAFASNNWAANWIANKQKAFLLALAAAGTVLSTLRKLDRNAVIWPILISWVGISVLFVEAPNPRFGLAYFFVPLATAAFCWSPDFPQFGRQGEDTWMHFGITIAVITIGLSIDLKTRGLRLDRLTEGNLILPERMITRDGEVAHRFNRALDQWELLRLESFHTNGVDYFRPIDSDQCWAAPLCTPDRPFLDPDFHARDTNGFIGAGFVRSDPVAVSPLSGSEVKEHFSKRLY